MDDNAIYDRLPEKRKRFVDVYIGNATKAAEIAGYSNPKQQGSRLLKNVDVCRLLNGRRESDLKEHIMSKKELQEYWTRVIKGEESYDGEDAQGVPVKNVPKFNERLKTSELLGRSQAVFVDRQEVTGKDGVPIQTERKLMELTDEELMAIARGDK